MDSSRITGPWEKPRKFQHELKREQQQEQEEKQE
jgi:hypothetical protein